MAQHRDDAFTPDTVDERVDQLASLAPQASSPPSAQVVQRLHALYEEDQRSTERVWQRLVQHVDEHNESDSASEYRQPGSLSGTQEGRFFMQGMLSPGKRGPTRLMLVAAVLFATLLVSSLLWVVHVTRSTPTTLSVKPTPAVQTVPASPPGLYMSKVGELSRLDAQSFKVIWHISSLPPIHKAIAKDGGKPVVIGDMVYLIRGDTLSAFDANKGSLRWSNFFDVDIRDISPVNGLLYVYPLTLSSKNEKFYAVDPTSGKVKATYKVPEGGWDTPTENGVRYYVSRPDPTGPGFLYALQVSSQKQLWHQQFDADQSFERVSVKNGIVYVSSMILATDKRKDTAGLLYAFDAKTGKKLWQSSEMPVGVRNYMVTDNMVYCASIGDFDAFDSRTGKHLWHLHYDVGDILVDAGVLYVNYETDGASGDGGIAALQPESGKKLWQTSFTGSGYHRLLSLQRSIIYTVADTGKVGSVDALRASDGIRLTHLSIKGNAIEWGAAVA